jgi:hypothetical protein
LALSAPPPPPPGLPESLPTVGCVAAASLMAVCCFGGGCLVVGRVCAGRGVGVGGRARAAGERFRDGHHAGADDEFDEVGGARANCVFARAGAGVGGGVAQGGERSGAHTKRARIAAWEAISRLN